MALAELRDLIPNPTAGELELVAQYGALPEDARRERAFAAFAETGLPHRRMEAWKWTDFKAKLRVIEAPSGGARPDPFDTLELPVIRFGPGGMERSGQLPEGLNLFEKQEAQAFGAAEHMPLGAVTAALSGGRKGPAALVLEVAGPVETPVRLVFAASRAAMNLSRVTILVRPGASLHLVESHLGGAGFASHLTDISVQEGGTLSRTVYQSAGEDAAQAITADVYLDARARFEQVTLGFGAGIARLETRLTHQGQEAQARLDAAYLAGKGCHVDITTHVRHGAERCVTRQLTKGAAVAGGRGVFQGKFHVPRIVGQHSDADMQHHALLLEDGAEIEAKPELEIYADDVECAHGNTCGALDGDQLFYLRQRGLPEREARGLLTEAFIAEAFETAREDIREILRAQASAWLVGDQGATRQHPVGED